MRLVIISLLLFYMVAVATAPQHSVTLNWNWSQGSGGTATGFHVQRGSITGGPYTVVSTVPVGTLTYVDTNVVARATYFYVVTAYNSMPSSEVMATIPFRK